MLLHVSWICNSTVQKFWSENYGRLSGYGTYFMIVEETTKYDFAPLAASSFCDNVSHRTYATSQREPNRMDDRDGTLIRLCVMLEKTNAAFQGTTNETERLELADRVHLLASEVAEMRATTPAGIIAKARIGYAMAVKGERELPELDGDMLLAVSVTRDIAALDAGGGYLLVELAGSVLARPELDSETFNLSSMADPTPAVSPR
jgi:hypothetical protein